MSKQNLVRHAAAVPQAAHAEPDYRALNLAQSVVIMTYLVRTAWLERSVGEQRAEPPAPFESQERMFASLQSALEAVHFLYGQSAATLMHSIRHLIGRAGPTQTEVDILLGLARQLRWFAEKDAIDHSGSDSSKHSKPACSK